MIEIIIPVRCMTCGRVLSGSWEEYSKRVQEGEAPVKVLDELGITKYCCRALFMTHVDMLKEVGKFRV
ncbi:MAG: DNA-directed RNA polymerase subunit N [Candidatus Aenigmatarchaeota archaeon]